MAKETTEQKRQRLAGIEKGSKEYQNLSKADKARVNYFNRFTRNGRFVAESDPVVSAIRSYENEFRIPKKLRTKGGDVNKQLKKVFNTKTVKEAMEIAQEMDTYEINTNKNKFFENLEANKDKIKKVKVNLDSFADATGRQFNREAFDEKTEFDSLEEFLDYMNDQKKLGARGIVLYRYTIKPDGTLVLLDIILIDS
jgi:hypothetical protein